MHDDRLRVRRVLAGADAGEIDDFSGITADGIDLGVQQVDLSLQLFLFLFHLLHFAIQFRHELIFLLPKLLLEASICAVSSASSPVFAPSTSFISLFSFSISVW